MIKVTFLFPRTGEIPIGGFKVIYEYGNRLIQNNVEVNYVYGIVSRKDIRGFLALVYRVVRYLRFLKYKLFIDYKPTKWFKMGGKEKHLLVYSLSEKNIPPSDIVIASSWATAFWLNDYKRIKDQNKFYFIQHFEDWHGSREKVIMTWKMNLKKIVIAPWLQKIAYDLGEKSTLIENGFSHDEFYLTTPFEDRNPYSAIMLWHDNPFKGCKMGMNALSIVKAKVPQFTLVLFGVPNPPNNLPEWITYYQMPEVSVHRNLYNQSAIFVGTSSSEGWGLTVGEAMLCGCAVACTNNLGYTILAEDNVTALLSPIDNATRLAENIIMLMEDQALRRKISYAGLNKALTYTWERSFETFMITLGIPSKV